MAEKVSLEELFLKYEDTLWKEGSHRSNVRSFVGEFNEILFGGQFSEFTQETLDVLRATLRERGNSNATINRKMVALSKLLRKAYKMGEIPSVPEFRREREPAARIRFLEPEEEDRLFAAIARRSQSYYRLSVFLVDTGAKVGEAICLRWHDFADGMAIFSSSNSGVGRSVPLTTRARESVALRERTGRGPFSDIEQHKYRAVWNQAKEDIDLRGDDIVPYVLRHTCASRLVRGGVDLRRVQLWLGHRTLQATMRYDHLANNNLDLCLTILERVAATRHSRSQGTTPHI